MPQARPLEDRLWSRVDRAPDGCWLWRGQRDAAGYGRIGVGGRGGTSLAVHRVVYELVVGPIPDGLDLDHQYRVRACVNGQRSHRGPFLSLSEAEQSAIELRNQLMTNNLLDRTSGEREGRVSATNQRRI